MEVPSGVLQKLVCERCSGYLSRGPVHLVDNTKYRCGRCPWIENADEEEGIRVEAYEELAQLMTFPCRYQENGCTSQVAFKDNKQHEEACPYREYLCPIAESGQCDWAGLQMEVLEHCQQDHPAKVLLENPCTFTYDITRPSLSNYVLFVCNVLFLIQCKVCTATWKIYYAVRHIDDPARASNFKFTLEIKNKLVRVIKHGTVSPRELMVLQEDTSVVTDINSLLEVLEDFSDTTFTVSIQSSGQRTSRSTLNHVTSPVQTLEMKVRCCKCQTVTEPVFRGDWLCKKHAPKQRLCKNSTHGCTYFDVHAKCLKHERYFCQYRTTCLLCCTNITGTTLDAHYGQVHADITHRANTVCSFNAVLGIRRIIRSDFGRTICEYTLTRSDFVLWLHTPIATAQLYKYKCTVDLGHPDTGHTLTCTPTVLYGNQSDWAVRVPLTDYNSLVYDNEVNIKITIT